jgi:cell division transport system permease protein
VIAGPAPRTPERRLLDDGRRARAMRWVMAAMLFLTVLAAALGLATRQVARDIDRQLGGRLVVQLLEGDAAAARVAAAVRGVPAVRSASVVPRATLAEQLRPWLGDAGLEAGLPMPAMIDIELDTMSDAAVGVITERARAIAPSASVDRSAAWLAPVRDFVLSLAWVAGGLVALTAGATAGIVLLAARAGLDTHRDTIEVLHMLGSTDVQVARLFQRRIALDTLFGGIGGTVAALLAVAAIGWRAGALEAGLVRDVGLGWSDWLVLGVLPLAFAGLATVAARSAVLRTLRRAL